jgi:hypothetical protein
VYLKQSKIINKLKVMNKLKLLFGIGVIIFTSCGEGQQKISKDKRDRVVCTKGTEIGFTKEIDGVNYKVVDSVMLYTMVKNGEDVSNVVTTKITNMSGLFSKTKPNGDITNWDVSNVTDMSNMFSYSDFNQDISKWDVSSVKNVHHMFYEANSFKQNLWDWKPKMKKNKISEEQCVSMFSPFRKGYRDNYFWASGKYKNIFEVEPDRRTQSQKDSDIRHYTRCLLGEWGYPYANSNPTQVYKFHSDGTFSSSSVMLGGNTIKGNWEVDEDGYVNLTNMVNISRGFRIDGNRLFDIYECDELSRKGTTYEKY